MRLVLFMFAAALIAPSALAQDAPLQKIYACAGLSDSAERLACYDAAVGGLKQAEASGGVAVVTPEQIAEAERRSFGFSQPATIADVARSAGASVAAPPPEPDSIAALLSTVSERADGRYRFTLDNGQVWEQADSDRINRKPKAGQKAEIKKASLGSFLMSIEGSGRGIRVRRVQ